MPAQPGGWWQGPGRRPGQRMGDGPAGFDGRSAWKACPAALTRSPDDAAEFVDNLGKSLALGRLELAVNFLLHADAQGF